MSGMNHVRKLSGWLVLLLSAAMMAGCGGDSDGQSGGGANALSVTGLTSVEIRDKASGRMLAFQRITQDGAMRTVVDTFQYQGQDTVWGTDDDLHTARTTCSYAHGEQIDERLQQADFFWPENLNTVSTGACFMLRPAMSRVDVSIQGGMVSQDYIDIAGASPTALALMELLGWPGLSMSGATVLYFSYYGHDGGIRVCTPDCADLGYAIPANTSCTVNCTGINNLVYNPYAGLNIYSNHRMYAGKQYMPSYTGEGRSRLERLSFSSDLGHPDENVDGYKEFHYNTAGALSLVETFSVPAPVGAFGAARQGVMTWRTVMHPVAGGMQRINYDAAGADGVWRTSDDVISEMATLFLGSGKVTKMDVCTAAGQDAVWQTPDDVCHTLTLNY